MANSPSERSKVRDREREREGEGVERGMRMGKGGKFGDIYPIPQSN